MTYFTLYNPTVAYIQQSLADFLELSLYQRCLMFIWGQWNVRLAQLIGIKRGKRAEFRVRVRGIRDWKLEVFQHDQCD
jgi:hypothetical protein